MTRVSPRRLISGRKICETKIPTVIIERISRYSNKSQYGTCYQVWQKFSGAVLTPAFAASVRSPDDFNKSFLTPFRIDACSVTHAEYQTDFGYECENTFLDFSDGIKIISCVSLI